MLPSTLVPSSQHKTGVIAAVVIMQMREEQVSHLLRRYSELHQSMMRAKSMIKYDYVIANLNYVTGTHSTERRRRRARAKQTDAHPQPLKPSGVAMLASLPNAVAPRH
jgi:hypothetical protein